MRALAVALASIALLSTGCASLRTTISEKTPGVKPWEREIHARPDMQWEPSALTTARRNHIYFSKESALPGGSAGGGGCGCN